MQPSKANQVPNNNKAKNKKGKGKDKKNLANLLMCNSSMSPIVPVASKCENIENFNTLSDDINETKLLSNSSDILLPRKDDDEAKNKVDDIVNVPSYESRKVDELYEESPTWRQVEGKNEFDDIEHLESFSGEQQISLNLTLDLNKQDNNHLSSPLKSDIDIPENSSYAEIAESIVQSIIIKLKSILFMKTNLLEKGKLVIGLIMSLLLSFLQFLFESGSSINSFFKFGSNLFNNVFSIVKYVVYLYISIVTYPFKVVGAIIRLSFQYGVLVIINFINKSPLSNGNKIPKAVNGHVMK